ncbi:hypothetical protein [Romboutsia sp.]|uniref:hypothetical protein n=1 Tax=Romboutsia sp. TaxID=1965302 RepID=UPI002C862BD0|nr:hypothetical protein [Romboutsia sp.]HSQ89776.1 hypothetical protein [Romboutsia sp.]
MFKGIAVAIAGVVVALGVTFAMGTVDNAFYLHFGKQKANIERDIFKEGKSYTEGMIEDLSNYKREFERTKDINEKEQIANMIDAEFANFDANKIENGTLYQFLMEIRNNTWR